MKDGYCKNFFTGRKSSLVLQFARTQVFLTGTSVCVCIPILVTTFSKWLSGTEQLQHTSVLVVFVVFCRFDKTDATADVQ